MPEQRRRIILDCDPGHDDAIAMLLAHGSPTIDLAAITTVAGNQTLDKVTRNARSVAELAGIRDVPIAAGCPRPLVRVSATGADIHGESGLDGPQLPEPTRPLDPRHGVDLIIETVMTAEPANDHPGADRAAHQHRAGRPHANPGSPSGYARSS